MEGASRDRIRVLPPIMRDVSGSDPIRVLHVDDDVGMGEFVQEFLEDRRDGFEVTFVPDASEALDRFTERPDVFDCVVSDYQMPGMDGLELLTRVREADSDVPFVLFTGRGSEEIASDAISAGVTEYLQKAGGVDRYELLANRIENLVEHYRAEARFRRALQAMEWSREGIALLDEAGQFVYVNYAYADIIGYDRDDLVGRRWETMYAEGEADKMETRVLPVISRTGRWEGETTFLDDEGDPVVLDHALAYTDDDWIVSLIQPTE